MAQDAPPTGTTGSRSTDANEAKTAAQDLGQTARHAGERAYETAAHEVQHQADAVRGRAADEVSNISTALRRAADETRDGSPQERTFGQMAEALADAADSIRSKDLGEAAAEVSDFARRNPLAFIGGAALLGFAASRFAKSTSRPDVPRTDPRTPPAASTDPRTPPASSAQRTAAPSAAPMTTEPLGTTTGTTGTSGGGTI